MTHHTIGRGADTSVLNTGRPVAMGVNGAVASPHYLASQVGLEVLQRGGHAADAAIAMNVTLSVVYSHMSGIGGDMFCQLWDNTSETLQAINGSGRSGRNVSIDFYKDKNMDEIPKRGPLAANTVPGAVDAWAQLHQCYGRLDWKELFQPAIRYAREGFPISQKYRDFIAEYSDTLKQYPGTSDIYLPDGKAPKMGHMLRHTDLADSLKLIAEKGRDAFYRGELADRIVNGLKASGGLLTMEDFDEHKSDWVQPISTDYKGYTVTELPPNTQGLATLMLLNLIEQYDIREAGDNSADYYHLMTEAVKLAFAERDRWVTDPDFLDIPVQKLISKEFSRELISLLKENQATPVEEIEEEVPSLVSGDTVYTCAVDSDGNACSLIQSVYFEFGSAFIPDGTGILMQNRGSFFKLDPNHPNKLEPKKRTFHTIIPAMALKDNKPFMCFGTMGGEGQPQSQTAMLTRIVDFGYNIQQAIEAPRWLYGRTWGEESRSLKLEGRVPDEVATELKRRGHEVQMTENWSTKMGHAQGIVVDHETGVLQAGADPRGDGVALAY